MNRIFIDTNIIISAIVFDKKELELIIRCISEGDKIYISEHIMQEATRVFMKKFPEYLHMFEKFIKTSEMEVIKRKIYEKEIKTFESLRDKYDAHVIACAKATKCKYIITGDKDLLNYKYKLIKIMKSDEYLKQIKK
jgi:putative PIN family toxin of toxin-antitoxin system